MHSVERHATRLYGSCFVHDVPWGVKSTSLEHFFPPWTVRRQVWSDSLKQQHSGVSIHHYRIHKRGLPHAALQRNYMSQLRALLPLPVDQPTNGVVSPVSTGPGSLRQASSAELVGESPRRTRRAKRRMRPVHVVETSVRDLPVLTLQDPSDVQGAVVYDCRPPLLPVPLDLSDFGPFVGAFDSSISQCDCVFLGGWTADQWGGGVHSTGCPGAWSFLHWRTRERTWRTSYLRRMVLRRGVDLELARALLLVSYRRW